MATLGAYELPSRLRPAESVRAGENFPVALRALPRRSRRHLYALYGYARFVDDLGDEPIPGVAAADRMAALDLVETQVRDLYAGRPVTFTAVAAMAATVAARRLPIEPLLRLVDANRIDQRVSRYDTFDQLVDYCTRSANPVGELVLHVLPSRPPSSSRCPTGSAPPCS
jgi:phytoene/squalene synthetase